MNLYDRADSVPVLKVDGQIGWYHKTTKALYTDIWPVAWRMEPGRWLRVFLNEPDWQALYA